MRADGVVDTEPLFQGWDGEGPEPPVMFMYSPTQLLHFLKSVADRGACLDAVADDMHAVFAIDDDLVNLRKVLEGGRTLTPATLRITPRLVMLMTIGHANMLLRTYRVQGGRMPPLRPGARLPLVLRVLRYCLAVDTYELAAASRVAYSVAEAAHTRGRDAALAVAAQAARLHGFARVLSLAKRLQDRADAQLERARRAYMAELLTGIDAAAATHAHLRDIDLDALCGGGEHEDEVLDLMATLYDTHPDAFKRLTRSLRDLVDWKKAVDRAEARVAARRDDMQNAVRAMDPRLVFHLMVAAYDHLDAASLLPWLSLYRATGVTVEGVPPVAELIGCPVEARHDAQWRATLDTHEGGAMLLTLQADERRREDELRARADALRDLLEDDGPRTPTPPTPQAKHPRTHNKRAKARAKGAWAVRTGRPTASGSRQGVGASCGCRCPTQTPAFWRASS